MIYLSFQELAFQNYQRIIEMTPVICVILFKKQKYTITGHDFKVTYLAVDEGKLTGVFERIEILDV